MVVIDTFMGPTAGCLTSLAAIARYMQIEPILADHARSHVTNAQCTAPHIAV